MSADHPDFVWHNVNRSSTVSKASIQRLQRQQRCLEGLGRPATIGLTEVGTSSVAAWREWAGGRGYDLISGSQKANMQVTALLMWRTDRVVEPSPKTRTESREKPSGERGPWLELQSVVVEMPGLGELLVGNAYCYGSFQRVVRDFEKTRPGASGFRLIGGDWNLIRSVNGRAGPKEWTEPAFAWVEHNSQLREIKPKCADGSIGAVDTWHVGKKMSRQLDHVFADTRLQQHLEVKIYPAVDDGGRVSDHEVLTATLRKGTTDARPYGRSV